MRRHASSRFTVLNISKRNLSIFMIVRAFSNPVTYVCTFIQGSMMQYFE